MSKKNREPSTPEMRAEKLANKQMLRKVFSSTFLKAFAICLAVLLIYSVCYIAFINPNSVDVNTLNPVSDTNAAQNAVVSNNPSSSNDGSGAGNDATPAGEDGAAVTELSASSSQADILAYFNTAINKVKQNAKQITLNYEKNKQATGISGSIPSFLTGLVDKAIEANMGDKDLSALDPGAVNATTVDQKNAMFPVENESWSSKLTADDIKEATVADTGSTYTITIKTQDDETSESTAHGVGHNGKVMSVIQPSIITENAEKFGLASAIKSVKTGHTDGTVKITVDKATGNVLTANYYFVWTLDATITGGINAVVGFGLEKDFTIAW